MWETKATTNSSDPQKLWRRVLLAGIALGFLHALHPAWKKGGYEGEDRRGEDSVQRYERT